NEQFVPVKVDREERPDLDAIYMDAVQAMTGSGGWPMTVFLTPEGVPFFAGTYFPKESRHGLPAFSKVLEAVAQAWSDRREDVSEQGRRVLESIGRGAAVARSAEPLTDEVLREAHAGLRASYDPRWGGFGRAPKFPQPMTLEFLLRCHLRGYPGALDMVRTTLDRMAAGGIHDHVGGGFHRYSVDERWLVPHFEKMLYDNAQLARLYAHAWQLTGDHRYRRVAERTLDYLLREMRHPEGGFFSSQDADSEGEEGRFFAWSWDELIAAVGESTARSLGATPRGNWEDGRNVLHSPDGQELSDEASGRLLQLRDARIHPATDDKVRGRQDVRRVDIRGRRGGSGGLRPVATAPGGRPSPPVVAGGPRRRPGVPRRPRAPGGGLPDPVRDDLRLAVLRRGPASGR
ncbi:MAG: thioredoxin domain-containing protein, partial [Actinobacteria bacterium]